MPMASLTPKQNSLMFTKIVMCILVGAKCKIVFSPYENKNLLFTVHENISAWILHKNSASAAAEHAH